MALTSGNSLWNALTFSSRGFYLPIADDTPTAKDRAHMIRLYWLLFDSEDIVDDSLDLLIEQFTESEKLHEFLRSFLRQAELALNSCISLSQLRTLRLAYGQQLDGLGDILEELRAGRNDDDYRSALYFRVFINGSSGEPETLINACKVMTKANKVSYLEMYPATVVLHSDGTILNSEIAGYLQGIAPAGVKVLLTGLTNKTPFITDGEGGFPTADGKGLNELGYTEGGLEVGGQLVELYT